MKSNNTPFISYTRMRWCESRDPVVWYRSISYRSSRTKRRLYAHNAQCTVPSRGAAVRRQSSVYSTLTMGCCTHTIHSVQYPHEALLYARNVHCTALSPGPAGSTQCTVLSTHTMRYCTHAMYSTFTRRCCTHAMYIVQHSHQALMYARNAQYPHEALLYSQ